VGSRESMNEIDRSLLRDPNAASANAVPVNGGGRIAYTETRIERIAPEVLRRNRIIGGIEDDRVVSAYNILRTQVLQRMVARGWNTLAITSPGPDQGKTLTAINLAICLAREVSYTVLLAELDLRKPGLMNYFERSVRYGVDDYLLRDVALSQILINPGIEKLVVLPCKGSFSNSSEMLACPKMIALVEELKSRYPSRFLIFDLPPVLSTDDALAFAPYVDATLLVVEEGKTSRDDLARAVEMLGEVPILGSVLNRSEESTAGY
jgi:capsular exopolysaccharide synthesis family protein